MTFVSGSSFNDSLIASRPLAASRASDDDDAGLLERLSFDNLDLSVSPETKTEVDKLESRITYWGVVAEGLQQISMVPRFLARHAELFVGFLKGHRFARLSTLFELAERGSAWMKLEPKTLKTLDKEAAGLSRAEAIGVGSLRFASKVLVWVGPLFAGWDVFKAVKEHNPHRRTALIGNAAISVVAGALSLSLPGIAMLIVLAQCLDASKGMRFSAWLGRTIQGEWASRAGH